MRLWIDLASPAHVPFFAALGPELRAAGHELVWTARDHGATIGLCRLHGVDAAVVGAWGDGRLAKAARLLRRAAALAGFARSRRIDRCLSHNSYAQVLAARWLGLPCATAMDFEHQPANHLAFRAADRVVVPEDFDAAALRRCGAAPARVRRYSGLKEEVYLAGLTLAPGFAAELRAGFGGAYEPGVHVLVTLRPPPDGALYHRRRNPLWPALLAHLGRSEVRVVGLPRDAAQAAELRHALGDAAWIPPGPLDGRQLVAHSDLVITAGGTMGREAGVLGVPAYSLFAGRPAGVDLGLERRGRLVRLRAEADLERVRLAPRSTPLEVVGLETLRQVVTGLVG